MNKRRRFAVKRRRAARRAWADEQCAKHVCAADRREVHRFETYLRGGMTVTQRVAYEAGR